MSLADEANHLVEKYLTDEYVAWYDMLDEIRQLEKDAELGALISSDKGREILADVSHEIWASWMKWQLEICDKYQDGALIPAGLVERWTRQINTPYKELIVQEQNSDREQADKIINALTKALCQNDTPVVSKSQAKRLAAVRCGSMICVREHGHSGSHMTSEEWKTASVPIDEAALKEVE